MPSDETLELRVDALARELERTREGSRMLIRAALRSARASAFEEAAQFCERKDRDGRNDFDNGWSHRGVTLARQLREKAKP